jgi:hypothetical protein
MIIRSPNVRPGEFAIGDAKRLLQQYLPTTEVADLFNHFVGAREQPGHNLNAKRLGPFSASGNPTQFNGRMFWFMRKKFFESYFVFNSWRRR